MYNVHHFLVDILDGGFALRQDQSLAEGGKLALSWHSRLLVDSAKASPINFFSFPCSVSPPYHDGTGADHHPCDFERANLQGDHAAATEEDQPKRQGNQHDLHRHRHSDLVRRLQLAKVALLSPLPDGT